MQYFVIPPQIGPYTNVLDLYLFPMMSKRHSEKLQVYNNTEESKKQIWITVVDVWASTSSADVARSFVLAYRVMDLIIRENGSNAWLAEWTPIAGYELTSWTLTKAPEEKSCILCGVWQ